jgi:alpha-galactosidase
MDSTHASTTFRWGHSGLSLSFEVTPDGKIGLRGIDIQGVGEANVDPSAPAALIEIRTVRDGSNGGHQNLHTSIGDRLTYRRHVEWMEGAVVHLRLELDDPISGVSAALNLSSIDNSSSFTASTTITNGAASSTTVLAVSAMMLELAVGSRTEISDYRLWWARNDWTNECRWTSDSLADLLVPDLMTTEYSIDSRRPYGISGLGSWPSGRYLPMAILENEKTGFAVAWQVENPGPWRWEVGDRRRSVVVGTFGPLDNEHQWSQSLQPDESFTTPDVTFSFGSAGWNSAIAELSRTRRARRHPHSSFDRKPVVYNDFFALFAEPTEDNLKPLIEATAAAGVEVFCIDAGWFDGEHGGIGGGAAGGHGWWDALGEFEESSWRFPHGMLSVIDSIRSAGMVPGIWLEPEVIGIRSPIAERLPPEAIFMRSGERVVEHGRYHLDFSHPAARAHADAVIDRVVTEYGFGYVKLDYNINPGPGSTASTPSAGAGLLAHSRAMLDWLTGVRDRHPELIIMNCASGGMRMDGATQRHTHVQQMSDQASALPFSFICAVAPTAVPSDQAAAWMNPDAGMTMDEIEFAAVTPQLSRFELSGPIDALSAEQKRVVADSIELYRSVRADVGSSDPVWPWGLPEVNDEWLTLAQRNERRTLVNVWHRRGNESTRTIVLPWLADAGAHAALLFPANSGGSVEWDDATATLTVSLPRSPMAILVEVG